MRPGGLQGRLVLLRVKVWIVTGRKSPENIGADLHAEREGEKKMLSSANELTGEKTYPQSLCFSGGRLKKKKTEKKEKKKKEAEEKKSLVSGPLHRAAVIQQMRMI